MQAFQRIRAADAKAMMEQSAPQIIDIRDAMSFDAGRITGAVRVDNQNLNDFMNSADKTTALLVCCYHGNSSQGAAQYFTEQGFAEVYSLDGGFEMWKMAFPDLCEQ